jgi:hypothetical protein
LIITDILRSHLPNSGKLIGRTILTRCLCSPLGA